MSEPKASYESFYRAAIIQLRDPRYSPGIHVVNSGFNEHLRKYYGKDINPTQITDQLVAEGKIEKKPANGGAMIYLPGEKPKQKTFIPPGGNTFVPPGSNTFPTSNNIPFTPTNNLTPFQINMNKALAEMEMAKTERNNEKTQIKLQSEYNQPSDFNPPNRKKGKSKKPSKLKRKIKCSCKR